MKFDLIYILNAKETWNSCCLKHLLLLYNNNGSNIKDSSLLLGIYNSANLDKIFIFHANNHLHKHNKIIYSYFFLEKEKKNPTF